MEPLIQEAMDSHNLQWGDMLGLIHHYLMIHYPGAQEKYEDGTYPIYVYGHTDCLKKFLLIKKRKAKSDKKRKKS